MAYQEVSRGGAEADRGDMQINVNDKVYWFNGYGASEEAVVVKITAKRIAINLDSSNETRYVPRQNLRLIARWIEDPAEAPVEETPAPAPVAEQAAPAEVKGIKQGNGYLVKFAGKWVAVRKNSGNWLVWANLEQAEAVNLLLADTVSISRAFKYTTKAAAYADLPRLVKFLKSVEAPAPAKCCVCGEEARVLHGSGKHFCHKHFQEYQDHKGPLHANKPAPTPKYRKGRVNRGNSVHYIEYGSPICGSGKSSHFHNYRRAYVHYLEAEVTCDRCKRIAASKQQAAPAPEAEQDRSYGVTIGKLDAIRPLINELKALIAKGNRLQASGGHEDRLDSILSQCTDLKYDIAAALGIPEEDDPRRAEDSRNTAEIVEDLLGLSE